MVCIILLAGLIENIIMTVPYTKLVQLGPYTTRCHSNAAQYDMILHTTLQLMRHHINQSLFSQNTPHILLSQVIYGVFIVIMFEKLTVL